jgi:hypothetical protein
MPLGNFTQPSLGILFFFFLSLGAFAQITCPVNTTWKSTVPYFCSEGEVQNNALNNYNKLVPPVESFHVPVDVKMGLNVFKLVNLDIQSAQIELSGA